MFWLKLGMDILDVLIAVGLGFLVLILAGAVSLMAEACRDEERMIKDYYKGRKRGKR